MSLLKQAYQRFVRFDPASDQLRHVSELHQIIGFNHKTSLAVKIWKFTTALMIAHALCFAYRAYIVWVQNLGFAYIICALDVFGGYVSAAFRVGGFFYYYDELRQFKRYLQENSSFQSNDPEVIRIRREHYINNQKFTLFLLTAGFGGIVVFTMTDYRMTDHYQIPFEMNYLNPTFKSIFDALYGLYLLFLGAHFWIPFLTIRVVLRIIRAELLIVNRTFAELFNKVINDSDVLMRHVSCSSQQAERIRSRIFLKCLHTELRRVLNHHRELLINVDRVRRLTSVPFFVEIFSSIMVMTFAIFLLMLLKGESLMLAMVSCIVMLECYYNSLLVEELQDVHADTARIIYDLEWPTMLRYDAENAKEYKNVINIMTFAIMRSQHRLLFKCGGMFEMSMETFTFSVKTCYSFLMFMMHVYNF